MQPERLKDRVALVTGGSSGIGRASALAFSEAGARVVVVDIDSDGGEETVRQVAKQSGEARFLRADVTEARQVQELIEEVSRAYGRLDCVHNNAGIAGERATTPNCTQENWDKVIKTNLKSVWLCLKYEIPLMVQQGRGAIVNSSSVYGLIGCQRGLPAYAASKHGIIGLTKTAALEYAEAGIRVNAVCPGAIDTPFRDQLEENAKTDVVSNVRYPVGRIGTAKEVADAVVWLCSDAASFMTGTVLVIDGGLTARQIM